MLNGQTEHSSSVVNGSRGSVHGLSWQCDGSHTLSAYEESLVDVAIDVWKRGGPGSVAAVPDWRHVAIMKQQAAPAPQYQPVPAPLYASATAPPQRYSQVPQYQPVPVPAHQFDAGRQSAVIQALRVGAAFAGSAVGAIFNL